MRRWGAVDKEKMAATGRRLCANWVVCYLGRATATGATSRHSSDFRHWHFLWGWALSRCPDIPRITTGLPDRWDFFGPLSLFPLFSQGWRGHRLGRGEAVGGRRPLWWQEERNSKKRPRRVAGRRQGGSREATGRKDGERRGWKKGKLPEFVNEYARRRHLVTDQELPASCREGKESGSPRGQHFLPQPCFSPASAFQVIAAVLTGARHCRPLPPPFPLPPPPSLPSLSCKLETWRKERLLE